MEDEVPATGILGNYQEHDSRNVPVNLFVTARKLGQNKGKPVRVARFLMSELFEGLACEGRTAYFVAVNSRYARENQRFSVAYLLSMVALGYLRRTTLVMHLTDRKEDQEKAACKFARELLIPSWFLQEAMQPHDGDSLQTEHHLARCCKVSPEVLWLRIRDICPAYKSCTADKAANDGIVVGSRQARCDRCGDRAAQNCNPLVNNHMCRCRSNVSCRLFEF